MRNTKILATLGPVSSSKEVIGKLIEAGADAFRLNFSHGTHEQHEALIRTIREEAARSGRFIPIVADIQGPKIRIGEVPDPFDLREGERFTITTRQVEGNSRIVSTPFEPLPREVRPGHRIMINDGLVELRVITVDGQDVETEVLHGGPVASKKGMNFPDSELTIPAITEKDRIDLRFAAEQHVDYVAASFIRRREDIDHIRAILTEHGEREIFVIAKLEKAQAIENLESILEVSDGVMVARGDLGVELPPERVPIIQKRVLEAASRWGRFAITATQMLESMTSHSRPTRAEASDVANAIFDGSDAVMLSAETASGAHPVESVQMMSRIVMTAEQNSELSIRSGRVPRFQPAEGNDFTDPLAGAANYTAEEIDAKLIVVFTTSGFTARLMSKFRPRAPIVALTRLSGVARKMNLLWGVTPRVLKDVGEYHEQIVASVDRVLLEEKLAEEGDRIVILMGSPIYEKTLTNLLRVHRVELRP